MKSTLSVVIVASIEMINITTNALVLNGDKPVVSFPLLQIFDKVSCCSNFLSIIIDLL